MYALALALTLALEVAVVAALYPGQRLRLGLTCALATTVTHLAMHFALPPVVTSYAQWLIIGEVGALLLEALAYALVARPREPGRALIASAAANAASFGVGLLIFPIG